MRQRFRIISPRSRFEVKVTAAGILSFMGHSPTISIRDFAGSFDFDSTDARSEGLDIVVDPATMQVTDKISAKDRAQIEQQMQQDVLETARFPQIVFKSQQIAVQRLSSTRFRLGIAGELALHGVRRELDIGAQLTVGEFGTAAHLSGQFLLKQSDFQIRRVTAVGGALAVKDQLAFDFDILAEPENANHA